MTASYSAQTDLHLSNVTFIIELTSGFINTAAIFRAEIVGQTWRVRLCNFYIYDTETRETKSEQSEFLLQYCIHAVSYIWLMFISQKFKHDITFLMLKY